MSDKTSSLPNHLRLLQACRDGDLETVQSILLYHQPPQELNACIDGHSPLREAARNGHYRVVRLLLAATKNEDNSSSNSSTTTTNALGATPLHLAACQNHVAAVRLLLKNSPSSLQTTSLDGWTPLHWAAAYGCEEVVRILTPHHQNKDALNGAAPVHLACRGGHLGVVKQLYLGGDMVRNDNNETALHVACRWCHPSVVEWLLQQGKSCLWAADVRGRVPIDVVPTRDPGNVPAHRIVEVLRTFMNENTRPSPPTSSIVPALPSQEADEELSRFPLHEAVENDQLDTIALLIYEGADIDARRDGVTALHLACKHANLDVVELLIEEGASTSMTDNQGWTATDVARSNNHRSIVKLLNGDNEEDADTKSSAESSLDDIPLPPLQLGSNIACNYGQEWMSPLCGSDDDSFGVSPQYHHEESGWMHMFDKVTPTTSRSLPQCCLMTQEQDQAEHLLVVSHDKTTRPCIVDTECDRRDDILTTLQPEEVAN